MKKVIQWGICVGLICVTACERPQSPDFKLDHKVQAPLTINKSYTFLGNNKALIDTSSEDYDSLFVVDPDGLVHLSKEEEFNMGNLDDAIPEIEVNPKSVNSKVGEIELGNFSSDGNIGTASFSDITGKKNGLQEDDWLPGGRTTNPFTIQFTTDYFKSATIKEDGHLDLTLTNNLGFDVDDVCIELKSGSTNIGNTTIGTKNKTTDSFNHTDKETGSILVPAGSELSDLSIEVCAGWEGQYMQADAGNLVVNKVTGRNLVASKVEAAIESQVFEDSGTSDVDDNSFKFKEPEKHYIELRKGQLQINHIINEIDVGVDELLISFPSIRQAPYGESDSLVVELKGSNPSIIPRSSDNAVSKNKDLSDYRIYAYRNSIDYNIKAVTENTQNGSNNNIREIEEDHELGATVNLNDLEIRNAKGYVVPKNILLGDDSDSNGKLDVFNNEEAEVTKIDGISNLSDQISNITFANPLLNMIYETNLGVNTTIYASIVGINQKGESVFLQSNDKSNDYFVTDNEIPQELRGNGQELSEGEVIKFKLHTPTDDTEVIPFNTDNTNISEFFSNLPSNIHFIGVAKVNEAQEYGAITNPVVFEPNLGIDIPIDFSAKNATFKDTLDADLNDLPGKNDDQQLSEAVFTVGYTNNLPLDLKLKLNMLNSSNEIVTVVGEDEPLLVNGASVDTETGFVSDGERREKLEISLDKDQLRNLSETRFLEIDLEFNTLDQQEVKIRAEDAVSFDIKMSVDVTSTVN